MRFSIWIRLQERLSDKKMWLTTHPYGATETRLRIPVAWGDRINEDNVARVEEVIQRCQTELNDILG